MTLQTQHTVNAPATLTDAQRQRVSDALKSAQSINTRRNYAGQYRKFRAWCEHERAGPAAGSAMGNRISLFPDFGGGSS